MEQIPVDLQELVSVETLGRLLEIPGGTIRHWVLKRQIPYHKVGRHVRFHLGEVREWYRRGRVEPLTREIIKAKIQ